MDLSTETRCTSDDDEDPDYNTLVNRRRAHANSEGTGDNSDERSTDEGLPFCKRPRTEYGSKLAEIKLESGIKDQSLKALNNNGGLRLSRERSQPVKWTFIDEVIDIEEKVCWIPKAGTVVVPEDVSVLTTWRKIAHNYDIPSTSIDSQFVTTSLQKQLMETRVRVSEWNRNLLLGARVRSNPFETLRHAFFMNRAALKIANLDAILGFELTTPKTANGVKIVCDNELYYFADVCAGPGGFSEYVLWKNKWEAKGFGMTLRNSDCDFNLPEFLAGTPESFEISYGAKGDGNVLDPANVVHFVRYILDNTDGKGVHLMMADGGIEIDDTNGQEHICKGLYLAQFLFALGIVREGGNFVCKLFDTISPFSVGLIYLIYCSFDQVSIHKPHSSRPANPERYIICKRRKSRVSTQGVYEYLTKCHDMLWNYDKNTKTGVATLGILELVPMNILTDEKTGFFKYIKNVNDALATSQILALQKMEAFCVDQTLTEIRQKDCRLTCLVYWDIPDMTRRELFQSIESTGSRGNAFDTIRQDYKLSLFAEEPEVLTTKRISEIFTSPFDWRFIVLASGPIRTSRAFFYGTGGTSVMRFQANYWRPINFNISLPKDTCVLAELVCEVSIELKEDVTSFHIIDGFILGGKDIRNLHYTQRHEWCAKFAKAMNKTETPGAMPVRVKRLTRMEHIASIFENLVASKLPEDSRASRKFATERLFPVEGSLKGEKYFHPVGLLFLKITKEPWLMEYHQQAGRKYWLNLKTKESAFDCPIDAIADFKYTTEKSVIWNWDEHTQVDVINTLIPNPASEGSNEVHVKQIVDHVDRFLAHVLPAIPIFSYENSKSDESESE